MGMHARSLPQADKDKSLAALRSHQQELQSLKKRLQQAEIAFTVRILRVMLFIKVVTVLSRVRRSILDELESGQLVQWSDRVARHITRPSRTVN